MPSEMDYFNVPQWVSKYQKGQMKTIYRGKFLLHPNNMNREDGFSLSWAWKPLIRDLREWRQSHTEVSVPSNGP
jgi:hypothetical protein